MPRRKTNIQAVKDMMERSEYGALAQAFIMDAIGKYSAAVSEASPSEFENSWVSGPSWQGVAREIKLKLDQHFSQ